MKIIFILIAGLSLLNASFIKSTDVVKDTISKVEWQDKDLAAPMKWQAAIDYCHSSSLAGYNDWRLPNINELKSIVSRVKYPAIVPEFTQINSSSFWSSTTDLNENKQVWTIYFGEGTVSSSNKNYNYHVRCIRGGE